MERTSRRLTRPISKDCRGPRADFCRAQVLDKKLLRAKKHFKAQEGSMIFLTAPCTAEPTRVWSQDSLCPASPNRCWSLCPDAQIPGNQVLQVLLHATQLQKTMLLLLCSNKGKVRDGAAWPTTHYLRGEKPKMLGQLISGQAAAWSWSWKSWVRWRNWSHPSLSFCSRQLSFNWEVWTFLANTGMFIG